MLSLTRAIALTVATLVATTSCDRPRPAVEVDLKVKRTGNIRLERVATLRDPLDLAVRVNYGALYVATRPGRIYSVALDESRPPRLWLDLTEDVFDDDAAPGRGGEAGMLGLTFSPDGRRLYVTYTGNAPPARKGYVDTRRVHALAHGPCRQIVETDRHELLQVATDTYTRAWTTGDRAGDTMKTGQDPSDLFASILRIDPTPTHDRPYTIPSYNPFVKGGGAPEVWLFGVRNPWRFSLDRQTSDLWVADVGDKAHEEIKVLRYRDGNGRGANLGWSALEGSTLYLADEAPPGSKRPLFKYGHSEGCAIIRGYVYRGQDIPDLWGSYLFSDHCSGWMRALRPDGSATESLLEVPSPTAFGEDSNGELYLLSLQGDLSNRITLRKFRSTLISVC